MNTEKTRIIYFAYPDNRWATEAMLWFHRKFTPFDAVTRVDSPYIPARNRAIRDLVLPVLDRYTDFVFCDCDIRPDLNGGKTDAFLAVDADIVGCEYALKAKGAFASPDVFHSGLWRAKSEVFRKLSAPWFMWEYTPDGCGMVGCDCSYFRKKALEAGLTIAHAGWAEHDENRSWSACS